MKKMLQLDFGIITTVYGVAIVLLKTEEATANPRKEVDLGREICLGLVHQEEQESVSLLIFNGCQSAYSS